MLRISFHAPGKTSLKMSKIAREICVQVRAKFGESQETFFQIIGGNLLIFRIDQPYIDPCTVRLF